MAVKGLYGAAKSAFYGPPAESPVKSVVESPAESFVWYIPYCTQAYHAHGMVKSLLDIQETINVNTFAAEFNSLPPGKAGKFKFGLAGYWPTFAQHWGLPTAGIHTFRLKPSEIMPPALLGAIAYAHYAEGGLVPTALRTDPSEYVVELNGMAIHTTTGSSKIAAVVVHELVPNRLPQIWSLDAPAAYALAKAPGSISTLVQMALRVCVDNMTIQTIVYSALAPILNDTTDKIPGTMLSQPTNYVDAFGMILQKTAKDSSLTIPNQLRLKAAAHDLSVETFPAAWAVWVQAVHSPTASKHANFTGFFDWGSESPEVVAAPNNTFESPEVAPPIGAWGPLATPTYRPKPTAEEYTSYGDAWKVVISRDDLREMLANESTRNNTLTQYANEIFNRYSSEQVAEPEESNDAGPFADWAQGSTPLGILSLGRGLNDAGVSAQLRVRNGPGNTAYHAVPWSSQQKLSDHQNLIATAARLDSHANWIKTISKLAPQELNLEHLRGQSQRMCLQNEEANKHDSVKRLIVEAANFKPDTGWNKTASVDELLQVLWKKISGWLDGIEIDGDSTTYICKTPRETSRFEGAMYDDAALSAATDRLKARHTASQSYLGPGASEMLADYFWLLSFALASVIVQVCAADSVYKRFLSIEARRFLLDRGIELAAQTTRDVCFKPCANNAEFGHALFFNAEIENGTPRMHLWRPVDATTNKVNEKVWLWIMSDGNGACPLWHPAEDSKDDDTWILKQMWRRTNKFQPTHSDSTTFVATSTELQPAHSSKWVGDDLTKQTLYHVQEHPKNIFHAAEHEGGNLFKPVDRITHLRDGMVDESIKLYVVCPSGKNGIHTTYNTRETSSTIQMTGQPGRDPTFPNGIPTQNSTRNPLSCNNYSNNTLPRAMPAKTDHHVYDVDVLSKDTNDEATELRYHLAFEMVRHNLKIEELSPDEFDVRALNVASPEKFVVVEKFQTPFQLMGITEANFQTWIKTIKCIGWVGSRLCIQFHEKPPKILTFEAEYDEKEYILRNAPELEMRCELLLASADYKTFRRAALTCAAVVGPWLAAESTPLKDAYTWVQKAVTRKDSNLREHLNIPDSTSKVASSDAILGELGSHVLNAWAPPAEMLEDIWKFVDVHVNMSEILQKYKPVLENTVCAFAASYLTTEITETIGTAINSTQHGDTTIVCFETQKALALACKGHPTLATLDERKIQKGMEKVQEMVLAASTAFKNKDNWEGQLGGGTPKVIEAMVEGYHTSNAIFRNDDPEYHLAARKMIRSYLNMTDPTKPIERQRPTQAFQIWVDSFCDDMHFAEEGNFLSYSGERNYIKHFVKMINQHNNKWLPQEIEAAYMFFSHSDPSRSSQIFFLNMLMAAIPDADTKWEKFNNIAKNGPDEFLTSIQKTMRDAAKTTESLSRTDEVSTGTNLKQFALLWARGKFEKTASREHTRHFWAHELSKGGTRERAAAMFALWIYDQVDSFQGQKDISLTVEDVIALDAFSKGSGQLAKALGLAGDAGDYTLIIAALVTKLCHAEKGKETGTTTCIRLMSGSKDALESLVASGETLVDGVKWVSTAIKSMLEEAEPDATTQDKVLEALNKQWEARLKLQNIIAEQELKDKYNQALWARRILTSGAQVGMALDVLKNTALGVASSPLDPLSAFAPWGVWLAHKEDPEKLETNSHNAVECLTSLLSMFRVCYRASTKFTAPKNIEFELAICRAKSYARLQAAVGMLKQRNIKDGIVEVTLSLAGLVHYLFAVLNGILIDYLVLIGATYLLPLVGWNVMFEQASKARKLVLPVAKVIAARQAAFADAAVKVAKQGTKAAVNWALGLVNMDYATVESFATNAYDLLSTSSPMVLFDQRFPPEKLELILQLKHYQKAAARGAALAAAVQPG